jgi:hypothetical protein
MGRVGSPLGLFLRKVTVNWTDRGPTSKKKTYRDLAHGLGLPPKGPSLKRNSTSAFFQPLFTELVDKPVLPGVRLLAPVPRYPFYEREMPMTSEMSEISYQAVRCSYCSKPIPLSTRLLKLFVTVFDNTAEPQSQSQVFILRCEACSKESRYLKAEIDTLEGGPLQRGDVNRFGPSGYPNSLRKAAGQ